ncbi:hypothetical protein GWK47_020075 [Chionoecetes opilio]|uniref:Uncharacterized protein n=1 Tax=Chionoecetes opilio TaxID=41210 RepID=A0A8J4XQ62_CHIOP|nr:hypothetical protein GWK47_020075 [Chionoecetes opilio]
MDGKGVYPKIPSSARILRSQPEEGADPGFRLFFFFVTTYGETRGCPPISTWAPGNGPAPPKALAAYRTRDRAGMGERCFAGTCGTSPGLWASPLREATGSRRRGPRSPMQQGAGGEEPARRAEGALELGQRPPGFFCEPKIVGLVPALGAGVTISSTSPGRVVGEGRKNHGSWAPRPTGVNTLREGVA